MEKIFETMIKAIRMEILVKIICEIIQDKLISSLIVYIILKIITLLYTPKLNYFLGVFICLLQGFYLKGLADVFFKLQFCAKVFDHFKSL